jgi:hypothetical protein
MVSLLPKIDRVNTLEELAAVLVTMAARIGLTGSSSISKRTERRGQPIARTTISEALSGERVPRLEVVLGIGRASMALEPEVDALANAWVRVTEARAFQPHMPPPTSQVRAISPARSETYSRRRRRHRDVENYLVILIGIVILATTTLMALTLNK